MLEDGVSVYASVFCQLGNSTIDRRVDDSAHSMKKFEVLGGLVSGTEESRGKISLDRPNRQWDYP